MINFSSAELKSISVHYVGNKTNGQELILSQKPLAINGELALTLRDYFLHKFSSVLDRYHFSHSSSLRFNEIYNFIKSEFSNEKTSQEVSDEIAKHLYEKSVHPQIKSGELYVCHFENCLVEDELVDVIGIFKTENRSKFFEVNHSNREFDIKYREGIDATKFDKGCIILNIDKDEGYQVLILDSQNKGQEAVYWRENFLGLMQTNNDFHQTNQFLSIAKSFVTKQLDEDKLTKTDRIDLLNKSVEYFKNNETFNKVSFEKEVFQDNNTINSFRSFDESYRSDNEIEIQDSFGISAPAVKKQAKVFKSVLKLDKNFQIYIQGGKNLIEQGVEADGRKFYKIYYKEKN